MKTWDDVISSMKLRPGGGYAKLAKRLQMDPSRLSAILRGRAMPAIVSRTKKPPEIERMASALGLSTAEVDRISANTVRQYERSA